MALPNRTIITSTRLNMLGKEGKPTKVNGRYEVILGALNVFNAGGIYYTAAMGVEKLFQPGSAIARRIEGGYLYGELGHPDQKPGESNEDFDFRYNIITESQIAFHISSIVLDYEFGQELAKRNPALARSGEFEGTIVPIIGYTAPHGPHASTYERMMEDPLANAAHSIRSIADEYSNGSKIFRVITKPLTWDVVSEPGIGIANKWDSPATERAVDTNTRTVTVEGLERAVGRNRTYASESNKMILTETLNIVRASANSIPSSASWKSW